MEIKELNYLIAIAEEKSISKAADRLYMAQSSLSQFLQTLESSLDSKLFVRTSRGVRLTEAGTIMLKYAYATLAEYHRTQDKIQDLKDLKSGSVILGISGFRGSYLLPPVLNAFKLDYPGIRVQIVEQNSMALEQMLLNGEIDVALLVLPVSDSRIQPTFVMNDEICLIAHENHPIMDFARKFPAASQTTSRIPWYVNLADAIRYEFFLSDYDTILGREARRVFSKNGLQPITCNESSRHLWPPLWALQAMGWPLPTIVPGTISEMQNFYHWVRTVLPSASPQPFRPDDTTQKQHSPCRKFS